MFTTDLTKLSKAHRDILKSLQPDDLVDVTLDNRSVIRVRVTGVPRDLSAGSRVPQNWVVWLDGFRGAYALARCAPAEGWKAARDRMIARDLAAAASEAAARFQEYPPPATWNAELIATLGNERIDSELLKILEKQGRATRPMIEEALWGMLGRTPDATKTTGEALDRLQAAGLIEGIVADFLWWRIRDEPGGGK